MSIMSQITALSSDISSAYDTITSMGGSVTQGTLYLATSIASIPQGGGGGQVYQPNFWNLNALSVMTTNSEVEKIYSFPGIVNIEPYAGSYMYYKGITNNTNYGTFKMSGIDFPDLLSVMNYGLYCTFLVGPNSGSTAPIRNKASTFYFNFPKLEYAGDYAFYRAFLDVTPATTIISKQYRIVFPRLSYIGNNCFTLAFFSCRAIYSISFPALSAVGGTNALGGSTTYTYMFGNYASTIKEIHFPAAMLETILSQSGYAGKFGAASATIYFDL